MILSFIISKRLYHASFNEPTDPLTVPHPFPPQTPSCILFSNSCKTQNVFPSWLAPCDFEQRMKKESDHGLTLYNSWFLLPSILNQIYSVHLPNLI